MVSCEVLSFWCCHVGADAAISTEDKEGGGRAGEGRVYAAIPPVLSKKGSHAAGVCNIKAYMQVILILLMG
jgi:hypothetical protein